MATAPSFMEQAKMHLDRVGEELSEVEKKLATASDDADNWTTEQAEKLKADWNRAREEMDSIAKRIESEGEEAVNDAKAKAERHWDALKSAVKTYRDHVERAIS
ncbi:hypothetical protein [Hoeflea poritis]|uniref:Uncharacterized protein n=1 Tax=Hoeflea poritis TaxID=2993659 RepID=A0ABT4VQP9_9HYPH|nr:hypothetical protein [Hoeflea poritis]MDA4847019.1 hypothetical protein [Hoeflea poritis]